MYAYVYAVFSDDDGATGQVDEKFAVVHWNGNCGTEHTAKVRDRDNLSMDYSFKDAAPDDKPKYGQPKVNLLRAENNGTITLHETTVEGQATADKGTKARNSIWTKAEPPDTEFLVELNVSVHPSI